jgi:hypothetical protein
MMPDKNRAVRIVAEIIHQAGGVMTGTTGLYAAFYLAHLYYAESEPGYLSDWPIVKVRNGPAIHFGSQLIAEMKETGILSTEHIQVGPFRAVRLQLCEGVLPGEALQEDAIHAIGRAVELLRHKSMAELHELIRDFSRSWHSAQQGEEMSIYIDPIPDDEYESGQVRLAELRTALEAAWK